MQIIIFNYIFMKKVTLRHIFGKLAMMSVVALLISACATGGVRNPRNTGVTVLEKDETGFVETTGIESQDISAVTDKMARSLLEFEPIYNSQGPAVIEIRVENATRTPVNKDLFIRSIRGKLIKAGQGKLAFVDRQYIGQDEKERNMKREGAVTASSDPFVQEFKGVDYRLQGKLLDHNTRTSRGISDYILYSFELVDSRTNQIVWADEYETKKQALLDLAY